MPGGGRWQPSRASFLGKSPNRVGRGGRLATASTVKAPIHTQHMGQHGDDGLIELTPWSWPSGSHGAIRVVLGQRSMFWPRVHIAWSRGNTGTHPQPALWASPMGSNPTQRCQCGHRGSTGRPGQNGETPCMCARTHTHPHTQGDPGMGRTTSNNRHPAANHAVCPPLVGTTPHVCQGSPQK